MVSMLETLAARQPQARVHYVHGARDVASHAMGDHVRRLAAAIPASRNTVFYESVPEAANLADHERTGRISGAWLASETPVKEADYYLCGPRPFLRALVSDLVAIGVSADRIHYEFFGPADEALAA